MKQEMQIGVFEPPLREGIVRRRRNRFLMEVEIDGTIRECHCPATSRIGKLVFQDIACLVSSDSSGKRKTAHTVEAISVDPPAQQPKTWIGINQNAANRYVEQALRKGMLAGMVEPGLPIKREAAAGGSRLDFQAGDTYIEVKTPLTQLQTELRGHVATEEKGAFRSFERLLKQVEALSASLEVSPRAILLICYMYNPASGKPLMQWENVPQAKSAVQAAIRRGLEIWQIHLNLTPTGVFLSRYSNVTPVFI